MCVVDAKNKGFQCVQDIEPKEFFTPFDMGIDLICASPQDSEDFLKECKAGKVIEIPLCSYAPHEAAFLCAFYASKTSLTPEQADNYFCLLPKDRKRLIQRCIK